MHIQDMILTLQKFWSDQGCLLMQAYDTEKGAGTMSPMTLLRSLGPEPWNVAYVEPSRRPNDGRYGDNPNRLYQHHQFQVVMKPSPDEIQELYLESLKTLNIDPLKHDIRFVEDNWENPTLGAAGLGWEVWLDGMEITQFTYFQQIGGLEANPVSVELTYGIERLASYIQDKENVFDLTWTEGVTVHDIFYQPEYEHSKYTFEESNTEMLFSLFNQYQQEAQQLMEKGLVFPAYDYVLKCSHTFNLLDAKGVISVTERTGYIGRVRDLAREIAKLYVNERERLNFPMLKRDGELDGKTNVLFEVGLEEMPARFIAETEKQLKERTVTWLEENRLTYQSLNTYITPRRFAIQIIDLIDKQTDLETEVRGPAKKIALDENGDWSKAAIGFTKGQGVSVDDIYYQEVKGTEYIFVKKFTVGKAASEILPSFKDVILAMTFPKNMRWSNRRLRYIRPIKWIVAIENNGQIDFEIEGVQTSNKSKGHRFLGEDFVITNPLNYEKLLLDQYVIADRKKRQAEILMQLNQLATEKNWSVDIEADLLDEVTELVEYPTVFSGSYSDDYLIIPEEALITSMKVHQRYFPVRNQDGELLPFFVGVRNGNAKYIDNVVKGNEKVLNARLADGLFFYQEDQKQTIEQYNQKLEKIIFQQQLGTVADKVNRVRENAITIAKKLNLTEQEINQLDRAATISKFDLVTQMVDEFPELQGIMGQKYADLFGEDDVVAKAINEQYMPRQAKDQLPESIIGAILSVADKLDTIVGCIGVGLIPTGSQDPYALRRQAMGIIQILEQKKWPVSFEVLIDTALNQFADSIIALDRQADVREKTLGFIEGRISFLVKEENVAHDVIKAVTHEEIGVISHLLSKAKLLEAKRQDPSFKSAQEALGRVVNLAQIDETHTVDPALFENESERELFTAYQEIEADYLTKINQGQYQEALQLLEQITATINQFFDQTMVMVDNPLIKNNRIGLLNLIAKLIYQLANFKEIEWKQHF